MNIIVLFEDLFGVSVVLLQSAFETTSPFTCSRDFLLYISLQIKSLKALLAFAAVRCSNKSWMASIFPSFDTAAIDYNWQFVQTGLLNILH